MQRIHHPEELTYQNGVPFVIWCYWEGEEMSNNRLLSFNYLQQHIQVPVCLITPQNLAKFIKKEHPLPESYCNLSIVHRSDYIRAYLLHHYGGAWHDIKATKASYANVWKEFQDPNVWMIGRPEIPGGAAKVYTSDGKYVPGHYEKLIAVPSWVGRSQTQISKEILDNLEAILTMYTPQLKKFPAQHPREKRLISKNFLHRIVLTMKFIYQGRSLHYPLHWTLFGNVFHPVIMKYPEHISFKLPTDPKKNAGIYHRD